MRGVLEVEWAYCQTTGDTQSITFCPLPKGLHFSLSLSLSYTQGISLPIYLSLLPCSHFESNSLK